jgi:hypothetical protein
MGYEEDFLRYLQSLLSDVDRRIRRGHSRLTTTQELMKVGSYFSCNEILKKCNYELTRYPFFSGKATGEIEQRW